MVLAAGAIHSPQLLQLSGIGQSSFLERFGIKTVVSLPGVGANFQDHPNIRTSSNCALICLQLETTNADWLISVDFSFPEQFNQ